MLLDHEWGNEGKPVSLKWIAPEAEKHHVGTRTWLFQELANSINGTGDAGAKLTMVMGGAGTGKSVMAAKM